MAINPKSNGGKMDKRPFGFHEGRTLLKVAGNYPRLLDVLLECVQNCIDKGAQSITIVINQKQRNISIRDDGDGVTVAEFDKAISKIGFSLKKRDKLGRFGYGLISALGKCVDLIFISTPKHDPRDFKQWTFNTKELEAQEKIEGIPMQTRPDLVFARDGGTSSRGVTFVPWRTEYRIHNYTSDRQINRVTIDSLREEILVRFGHAMRKNKTLVLITLIDEDGERLHQEFRAKEFEGVKLPETEMQEKDCGKTIFRLFLAKKIGKHRRGKVLIGETGNDFRLDWGAFNRSLPEVCHLSDEVISALRSGTFEGEVLNSRIRLHVSRRGFEEDDALVGFCCVIEKWFEQEGSKHFEESQEEQKEERYQNLGIRSMKVIEDILQNFPHLFAGLKTFKKGSTGQGHIERKGKKSDETSVAVVTGQEGHTGGDNAEKKEPEVEKVDHTPYTVSGPKGKRRTIVSKGSLGLQLTHDPMQGSDRLWDLDEDYGVLRINILHPLWRQCEDHSDRTLMRFQEYIMLQALQLHSTEQSDWVNFARPVLDELNGPYVYMLVHGDALAGRQPGRTKSSSDESKPKLTLVKPKMARTKRVKSLGKRSSKAS